MDNMKEQEMKIEMTNDLCKIHSMPIPMVKGLDAWAPEIAEELIKLGWVKPNEDSIVILKEDWKENHDLALMCGKKEGSKETTDKIVRFLEDYCDCDSVGLVEQLKEYLAKEQLNVETKE